MTQIVPFVIRQMAKVLNTHCVLVSMESLDGLVETSATGLAVQKRHDADDNPTIVMGV